MSLASHSIISQHAPPLSSQPIGPRAASFWLYAVPWGFRKLLHHVYTAYAAPAGGLDVWITESGCDGPGEATAPLPSVLNDSFRLAYYKGYVAAAVEAAEAGVPIKGYFAWSLLDNFEWAGAFWVEWGGWRWSRDARARAACVSRFLYLSTQRATPPGSASPTWTTPPRNATRKRRPGGLRPGSRAQRATRRRVEERGWLHEILKY